MKCRPLDTTATLARVSGRPAAKKNFDPLTHGLMSSFVSNGHINSTAWRRAETDGGIIGTCRACGAYLVPDTPRSYPGDPQMQWYVARCVGCQHEFAAPNGNVLRRSARQSERLGEA